MQTIEIFVAGVPATKPQNFKKSDRWKPRAQVTNYHAWRDKIWVAFKQAHPAPLRVERVAVSGVIFVPGWKGQDADNYGKGICDTLVRRLELIEDDTIDHVRQGGWEGVRLCAVCPLATKGRSKSDPRKTCGDVESCPYAGARITVEILDASEEQTRLNRLGVERINSCQKRS